jgi:hypothetical protein
MNGIGISTAAINDSTVAHAGWVPVFAKHCGELKGRPRMPVVLTLLPAAFALCLAVNALDLVTTFVALAAIGPDMQEMNGLAQRIIARFGLAGGAMVLSVVKLGVPCIFYGAVRAWKPRCRKGLFWGLCVNSQIVFLAVANNVFALARWTRDGLF